jgi:hypothetical protein
MENCAQCRGAMRCCHSSSGPRMGHQEKTLVAANAATITRLQGAALPDTSRERRQRARRPRSAASAPRVSCAAPVQPVTISSTSASHCKRASGDVVARVADQILAPDQLQQAWPMLGVGAAHEQVDAIFGAAKSATNPPTNSIGSTTVRLGAFIVVYSKHLCPTSYQPGRAATATRLARHPPQERGR